MRGGRVSVFHWRQLATVQPGPLCFDALFEVRDLCTVPTEIRDDLTRVMPSNGLGR